MRYVISYDLNKGTRQDYSTLIGALDEIGAEPVMDSTWIIHINWTISALLEYVSRLVDPHDRILIARIVDEPVGERAVGRNTLASLDDL